jgi:prepilin peptidase CpaA
MAVALVAAGTAAVIDLRTGRIPNALTAGTAAAGLALAAAGMTGLSPAMALGGAAVGLALMLPGHLLGGTGAGDVKLMAALGMLLGPGLVVLTFLYSAIAGGVLAVAHAWRRQRVRVTFSRTAQLATGSAAARQEIDAAVASSRFAYGPAIAAGVTVAALWR